jgi:hypothetical protein
MKKLVTQVSVERIGAGYIVQVTNQRKQVLRYGEPKQLQLALTEAHELADFFGLRVETFHDVDGKVVRPEVLRDTYDDNKKRAAEELVLLYRGPQGELNWNKLVEYEWSKFRQQSAGGFRDKKEMMSWVAPFYMEGPQELDWLKANCKGAWIPAKGGVRFTSERDAVLYKMFHK